MTCIVGVEYGSKVYLAGDSSISWGDANRLALSEPKIRRLQCDVVIGVAGGKREGDIILYWTPPRWLGNDPKEWAVLELAPAIQEIMKGVHEPEYELLLGVGGTLLTIDSWGSCHGWPYDYGAVGSGADFALGALYQSFKTRPRARPKPRLTQALEAAATHSSEVCPKYYYISG